MHNEIKKCIYKIYKVALNDDDDGVHCMRWWEVQNASCNAILSAQEERACTMTIIILFMPAFLFI